MRILEIAAVCVALGGCAASPQGVASASPYGGQFVGKDIDALVARIGRPDSAKKIDGDQGSYVWELAPAKGDHRNHTGDGGLYGDGYTPGYISDDPRLCKVNVTTSREGIVTQLSAEDSNGTGAPAMTLGISGSVCAQRLGR